jgi:hypothetical protein
MIINAVKAGEMTRSPDSTKSQDALGLDIDVGVVVANYGLAVAQHALDVMRTPVSIPPPRSRRPHKPRKPSIATLVKRAEKTGKTVTSITTPDGTTIHFGETKPTDASNPWLAGIDEKATKQ